MEILLDTARLAHDKGYPLIDSKFSPNCNYSQENDYKLGFNIMTSQDLIDFKIYPAPTQSLLQKWLREEHLWYCNAELNEKGDYIAVLTFIPKNQRVTWSEDFNSFEEALEFSLQEALKLIIVT